MFFLVKFHAECRQNHVCGPPGARVMTIFVVHVDPPIPNIGYMMVYDGYQALGAHFVYCKCRQNHVWGPPGA